MDVNITAERFKSLRESLGFTQGEFAEVLGVKGSTADLERAKVKLPGFVVKELYKKYQINPLWLFGESDEMKLNHQRLPKVIQVDQENKEQVMMVPVKASAGYAVGIEEGFKELQTLNLPWLNTENNTFRAFQVEGQSMEPYFMEGDWVVASLLTDLNKLKEGQIYVVVDQEGVRLKNIHIQRDSLDLLSFNPQYPKQNISKSEVQEIWKFELKLSSHVGLDSGSDKELLFNLYKEFQELKSKL